MFLLKHAVFYFMFTYNITFIADPLKAQELEDYLRIKLIPEVFNPDFPALNPQLKKVIEIGGEKPSPEHGISIALSADFDTEESAHLWSDHILIPQIENLKEKIGFEVLHFVTLLEKLSYDSAS